jgi:uncharacterized protein (DUF302 family)
MKIIFRFFALAVSTIATIAVIAAPAFANEGMITVKSPYSVKDTINRLEEIAKQRNFAVVARVDHAAGAAKVNKSLRPTELLIFGNPADGTPLMECSQTIGIDLPLKALAWEDDKGSVWLGYNDTAYLAKRHGAPQCPAAANIAKAMAGLIEAAVKPAANP